MAQRDPNWAQWKVFFAGRKQRPGVRLLPEDPSLSSIPASVARSLAIFQLGESGGGTVVDQARSSALPSLGEDYADALKMFVAEEHRHAELLACCVRALHGKLITHNWTARLFVFGRRLAGLRLKIMVLLAAEVVGICYYHALAEGLPDSELKSVLREIIADERAHLRFHCDFFRTQLGTAVHRRVFAVIWRAVMFAAAVVVLLDHRQALSDLRIPFGRVWRRWMVYSRTAENRIVCSATRGAPVPCLG